MPKVSVIVPVYKTEKYINRCIDSILSQTFSDIEVILVDDGSPDNCPKICDEYATKDSRVKVIHQKNSGVSSARNAGLKVCCGEYLLFVDADDYISSDMIENLFLAIGKKYDVAISGYTEIGLTVKTEIYDYKGCKSKDDFILHCIQNTGGVVCSKLYKTSIIKKNDIFFNENLIQSEDLIFALNVFLKSDTFITIDKADYFYDRRDESNVNIDLSDWLNKNLIVHDLIQNILENYNIEGKAAVIKKRLENVMYIYLLGLVQKKEYRKFKQLSTNMNQRMQNLDFQEFDLLNKLWLVLYKKNYRKISYLVCNIRLFLACFLKKCKIKKGQNNYAY